MQFHKLILFLLTIFPLLSNGQSYYSFPTDSAIWSQVTHDYGDCWIVKHYGLVGDTIIFGKQYSKLYGVNHCYYDFVYTGVCSEVKPYKDIPEFNIDSAEYVGGVREDSSKRVYFYDADSTSEFLLYDFGLNVGDTFCFDYLGIGCFQVTYFDSVLINGQYRRTFHFNDWWDISWIEGVGNSIGWFELQIFGTGSRNLLCFKQNSDTLINTYGYCSCSPATTINEISNQTKNIIIYPNPTSDKLLVKLKDNIETVFEIKIMDVRGAVLKQISSTGNRTTVDISGLPSGLYFIEVFNDKFSYREKIIKY